MLALLDKIMMYPKTPKSAARNLERVARGVKSARIASDQSHRRKLVGAIPQNPELEHVMDPVRGFGWLPKGTLASVSPAIDFAQRVLKERRNAEGLRKDGNAKEDYLIHLIDPIRYEEAPPLFDLALSDEVLQIAAGYLFEVPTLLRMTVLWSPVNNRMKGSQFYHRDGTKWLHRRAKFIFCASDVDDSCGPFTFLPADVSERMSYDSPTYRMGNCVEDDDMYRYVSPSEELKFTGPAGSGLVIDSSRCFHFGSRSRGKERLVLMFQFFRLLDLSADRNDKLWRSPSFDAKFGNDPVRRLVIPDAGDIAI